MRNNAAAIAAATFVGNARNRIFLVIVLFGVLLLGASVLLALLGQEQEIRMLLDLGLGAIEMFSFLTAIFLVSNLVLEDMESKAVYLILTRAVSRPQYLLGRFLGAILSVAALMAVMTLAHAALLAAKGWTAQGDGALYALSVFMSFEKIVLISAVALFFSLFSSSGVVALVFTFFFWVLGHFGMELRFLAQKIEPEPLRAVFKAAYFLIPQFQYMNARDIWIAAQDRWPEIAVRGAAFTLAYSAAAFLGSVAVFRKKEF